jgi:hypothetical protein
MATATGRTSGRKVNPGRGFATCKVACPQLQYRTHRSPAWPSETSVFRLHVTPTWVSSLSGCQFVHSIPKLRSGRESGDTDRRNEGAGLSILAQFARTICTSPLTEKKNKSRPAKNRLSLLSPTCCALGRCLTRFTPVRGSRGNKILDLQIFDIADVDVKYSGSVYKRSVGPALLR